MWDFGFWTKAQYDDFMRSQQAVKATYGPAGRAPNVCSGDSLAFSRVLHEYIRRWSGGKYSLFDVVRAAGTGKEQAALSQIQKLIKEVTGVDPAPFFAARY